MKPFESTLLQVTVGLCWNISLLGVSWLTAKETKACLEELKVRPFEFWLV